MSQGMPNDKEFRAPQLHSFLSYYLPTTLKILRAYGQLEDQEVSGQNITAAMKRIEGMMDKVFRRNTGCIARKFNAV